MKELDVLDMLAKRAPDEPALMIESAETITDEEFAKLERFARRLGKNVSPWDITLARDGTGCLHVLPYNINATQWRPGDTISFGQLASAKHEAWKLKNKYVSGSVKGKCARAQYKLFDEIGKGAARGAQNTLDDSFSIFDPNQKGWDKAKQGMQKMVDALSETAAKIVVDLFTPPILGLLKAPFHALGGAVKFAVNAVKMTVGLIQDVAKGDDPRRYGPVRTR